MVDLDAEFQQALGNSGEPYLEAEHHLREAGAMALPVLAVRQRSPDPCEQLLVRVLHDALGSLGAELRVAEGYLNGVGAYAAGTALRVPPPVGVANHLERRFKDRAAEFVALRLWKGVDWPYWKKAGALLYLQRVAGEAHPLVTPALIRFAAQVDDATLRAEAVRGLQHLAHPDLKALLKSERSRHQQWPRALAELER